MRKRILLGSLLVVLLGTALAWLLIRPEPADTRFSGAYAFEDGTLVFITPREGKSLRYRLMNGESAALWPAGDGAYEGGSGWAQREPVSNRIKFDLGAAARATDLTWQRPGGQLQRARRLALPERIVHFHSGELGLRGKLVTPAGVGPFPAVVLVHGSEDYSAVDHYADPYIHAAHGFASFAFDKRGTGESQGTYLQNFHVLAGDVLAAVRWLRTQPQIDPQRIHLAGYSQGGWIAQLAALQDGRIRSVLVGFGVMVPVTGEDRWGYVYCLQRKGYDERAITAADRINAVLEDIVDRHKNRWSELARLLDEARAEPWFEALQGSDSMLGEIAETKFPLWGVRAYVGWRFGAHRDPPYIDRLYDPVPTMQRLRTPSLWLLAGQDSSAPTRWTLHELQKLQAPGRPVRYRVFPDAEHGIMKFVEDETGKRRHLGYEPEYYPAQIAWLREHSGI